MGSEGGGGGDFYFKEKGLNSTERVPWGLRPQIKLAAGDLGPAEVRGEGKGSAVLPKLFPDCDTKRKADRSLMLEGLRAREAPASLSPHNRESPCVHGSSVGTGLIRAGKAPALWGARV